jgi:hypothetical protein
MPIMTDHEIKAKIADGTVFGISIDTAIFDRYGCNLDFSVLNKLDQFKNGLIEVLFSEIVVNEVKDHIARQAEDSRRQLIGAIRTQSKRWKIKEDISALSTKLAVAGDARSAASDQFEGYLSSVGGTVVPATSPADVTAELLRRYFAAEPPFVNTEHKKHEFPDAFALLSLEAHARGKRKLLLCVSPDAGWKEFCAKSDYLTCVSDLDSALSYFNESGRNIADKTIAMWKSGSAPQLDAEVERAFEYGLEDAQFEADGSSPFEYESEPLGAVMQYLKLDTATTPVVIAADEDTVTFTINVRAVIGFEAEFSFFLRDSIDRDYVPIGSEHFTTEDEFEFEVVINVRRTLDPEPDVVDVAIAVGRLEVDFGSIEPFPNEDPTHEKY